MREINGDGYSLVSVVPMQQTAASAAKLQASDRVTVSACTGAQIAPAIADTTITIFKS